MKVPSLAKGELLHSPEACRRLRPQAPQREIAVKGDLSTIPFPAPTGSCCDGQEEATARPAFAPACVHRGGDIQTTVPPSANRPIESFSEPVSDIMVATRRPLIFKHFNELLRFIGRSVRKGPICFQIHSSSTFSSSRTSVISICSEKTLRKCYWIRPWSPLFTRTSEPPCGPASPWGKAEQDCPTRRAAGRRADAPRGDSNARPRLQSFEPRRMDRRRQDGTDPGRTRNLRRREEQEGGGQRPVAEDRDEVKGAQQEAAGGELALQAHVAGKGGVEVQQAVGQDRVRQEAVPPAPSFLQWRKKSLRGRIIARIPRKSLRGRLGSRRRAGAGRTLCFGGEETRRVRRRRRKRCRFYECKRFQGCEELIGKSKSLRTANSLLSVAGMNIAEEMLLCNKAATLQPTLQ